MRGCARSSGLAEKIISDFAGDPKRPEFVKVANTLQFIAGGRGGPKLGIMPNYEEKSRRGFGRRRRRRWPGGRGGLKAGDLIVELGGKSVTNLKTYMVIMAQQRSGQTFDVGIVRAGKS